LNRARYQALPPDDLRILRWIATCHLMECPIKTIGVAGAANSALKLKLRIGSVATQSQAAWNQVERCHEFRILSDWIRVTLKPNRGPGRFICMHREAHTDIVNGERVANCKQACTA
jgi:hypothetical protein